MPPLSKFFHFYAVFSKKKLQNNTLAHPVWVLVPPQENPGSATIKKFKTDELYDFKWPIKAEANFWKSKPFFETKKSINCHALGLGWIISKPKIWTIPYFGWNTKDTHGKTENERQDHLRLGFKLFKNSQKNYTNLWYSSTSIHCRYKIKTFKVAKKDTKKFHQVHLLDIKNGFHAKRGVFFHKEVRRIWYFC